jgi:hypothetical protein
MARAPVIGASASAGARGRRIQSGGAEPTDEEGRDGLGGLEEDVGGILEVLHRDVGQTDRRHLARTGMAAGVSAARLEVGCVGGARLEDGEDAVVGDGRPALLGELVLRGGEDCVADELH